MVSFCIPTWNRADEVFACVTHILEHPSQEIEVVVSNNASDDDTLEKLATIGDARLRVTSNVSNIGMQANCLKAVQSGTGLYSFLINDEDRILLDKIDVLLDFIRGLQTKYVVIRFSQYQMLFDGICPDQDIPAGPEAVFHSMLMTSDYSGLAFRTEWIRDLDIGEYVIGNEELARGSLHVDTCVFDPGFFIMELCGKHPIRYSSIITHERFEGKKTTSGNKYYMEILGNGIDGHAYHPDNCYKLFCRTVDKFMAAYGATKYANGLYSSLIRTIGIRLCYRFMNSFMGQNYPFFTSLRDRDEKLAYRERLIGKYGTAWNLVRMLYQRCVQYMREKTGDPMWDGVQELCAAFFDNNLDLPVKDRDETQKSIAGDMIYDLGVHCTDINYVPVYAPEFFSAEFLETHYLYRQFCAGRHDWVIRFKPLQTKRDGFIRGGSFVALGENREAIRQFEDFLENFEHAETLKDIISGSRGRVLAMWYLGFLHLHEKEYMESMEYFAKCHALADESILRTALNEGRFNLLGLSLDRTNGRKQGIEAWKKKQEDLLALREKNRLFETTP